MKDKATVKGKVSIRIQRANGEEEFYVGENTIDSEIKNAMATSLNGAVTQGFGVLAGAFDGSDTGLETPTVGESGMIAKTTTGSEYFQGATVANTSANTGAAMSVKATWKSDVSKTFDILYLGHDWRDTNNYTYNIANHTLSGDIDMTNGDQLDVTWTITLADS